MFKSHKPPLFFNWTQTAAQHRPNLSFRWLSFYFPAVSCWLCYGIKKEKWGTQTKPGSSLIVQHRLSKLLPEWLSPEFSHKLLCTTLIFFLHMWFSTAIGLFCNLIGCLKKINWNFSSVLEFTTNTEMRNRTCPGAVGETGKDAGHSWLKTHRKALWWAMLSMDGGKSQTKELRAAVSKSDL